MVELRWLDYETVQGTWHKKLQYRYQQNDTMKDFHPDMRWTDWIDVRPVKDE